MNFVILHLHKPRLSLQIKCFCSVIIVLLIFVAIETNKFLQVSSRIRRKIRTCSRAHFRCFHISSWKWQFRNMHRHHRQLTPRRILWHQCSIPSIHRNDPVCSSIRRSCREKSPKVILFNFFYISTMYSSLTILIDTADAQGPLKW